MRPFYALCPFRLECRRLYILFQTTIHLPLLLRWTRNVPEVTCLTIWENVRCALGRFSDANLAFGVGDAFKGHYAIPLLRSLIMWLCRLWSWGNRCVHDGDSLESQRWFIFEMHWNVRSQTGRAKTAVVGFFFFFFFFWAMRCYISGGVQATSDGCFSFLCKFSPYFYAR